MRSSIAFIDSRYVFFFGGKPAFKAPFLGHPDLRRGQVVVVSFFNALLSLVIIAASPIVGKSLTSLQREYMELWLEYILVGEKRSKEQVSTHREVVGGHGHLPPPSTSAPSLEYILVEILVGIYFGWNCGWNIFWLWRKEGKSTHLSKEGGMLQDVGSDVREARS